MSKIKTALVIGHIDSSQGAISDHLCDNQVTEFGLFKDICENDLSELGDIFIHDDIKNYTARQKAMAERTKGYDLVFELHFNSFNKKAQGVEALHYYKNGNTQLIAQKFSQLIAEKMGIKIRGKYGAKATSKGNGFGFLYETKGWAVLLEPFFGDNKEDCEKFDRALFKEVMEEIIAYAEKLKYG